MEALRVRNGLLRGIKVLAFFVALVGLIAACVVFFVRSDTAGSISLNTLLSGGFVPDSSSFSWLQRNLAHDNQADPVLILTGGKDINVEIGGGYSEPGYTATDIYGNDISANVTAEIQENLLVYTVHDALGNTASDVRNITYVDTTPPEITLTDGADYTIATGVPFTDPGYTASDNADGDVTASVTVSGSVEKYKLGTYPVTYTVTDSSGNTASVTRNVIRGPGDDGLPVENDGKVVYLTFDDGPGSYTEELLDILDKYDAKVTFFVTAQFEDYLDMISEEARRGHTVALHTYSHDFEIYTSEETYFEDLYAIQDLVVEKTGSGTAIVRFPGGSSNTASMDYCYGIMTTLAADLGELGYKYFDWNVSSGDAGSTTDTETIYQNVIAGIAENAEYGESSVVLQHDIHDYSVAAVEKILQWGRDNGYTFKALTSGAPEVHHGINN